MPLDKPVAQARMTISMSAETAETAVIITKSSDAA